MKKLFYLFLIAGLVASSCKKPADIPTTQDVSFKAVPAVNNTFKESVPDKWPDCLDLTADYALITINGVDYWVEVFYLDNVIYTNTLKFPVDDYTVDRFWLYNNGTNFTKENGAGDDVLIQATPLEESVWGAFVNYALPIDFTVDAFMKTEVNISTICFEPNDYTDFGFAWFTVEEVIVREVCFYGDFCTKFYLEYGASDYAEQENGLQHDMPAIFKIDVYRNQDFIISYNNAEWFGESAPLCVKYPDYKNVVDTFEFKLSILVKVGAGFEYVPFHTFKTMDAQALANIGNDNVLDFVLGSCVTEADFILPPYMNLPETTTLKLSSTYLPGPSGTSFDVTLTGIPAGYDLLNGTYGAYFLEYDGWFWPGHTYIGLKLYSSLYPALINSPFVGNLDNLNWLMNNLYRYPSYTGQDIQNAMATINGTLYDWGPPSAISNQMAADALSFGDGFLPPVGGYAAIVFDPNSVDNSHDWVLLFIVVDP